MHSTTAAHETPVSRSPPSLPAGLRARVWINHSFFYDRREATGSCWLWLHRHDGRVEALRLDAGMLDHDAMLPQMLDMLDRDPQRGSFSLPRIRNIRRLPAAAVVPTLRWSVSWGHPVQQALRDFAATLDAGLLCALGDLEGPGLSCGRFSKRFFGSIANYNAFVRMTPLQRERRLQALRRFPPLLVPVLLQRQTGPEMFGNDDQIKDDVAVDAAAIGTPGLYEAIDHGRDLIGALAHHYGIDRALARSPLCRQLWNGEAARPEVLQLLHFMPAHARPRDLASLHAHLGLVEALPVQARTGQDMRRLSHAFASGWDATCERLRREFPNLPNAARDTSDFLRAALEQADLPAELAPLDMETLALGWLARRGIASLLKASQRWHAQPLTRIEPAFPPRVALPAKLEPLLGQFESRQGSARELLTEQALIDEGTAMHHCVGEYWKYCLHDGRRILHLELESGEQATLELGLDPHAAPDRPGFRAGQLRGPCNAAPGDAMRSLATAIESAINADDLLPQRVKLLADCHAIQRDGMARSLAMAATPTLRRLDNRSREELAQVLAYCARQEDWRALPGELFRGQVAGFRYAEGPQLARQLRPGDALTLAREPDNPHDQWAVCVEWRSRKLGYVPRPDNLRIAQMLDADRPLLARIHALRHDQPWTPVEFVVAR